MDDDISKQQSDNAAVNLIRQKVAALYAAEPDVQEEIAEAETMVRPRTKHQQVIHELTRSGQSLADIQTAWHNYYVSLPDDEKHQVWQEFYAEHAHTSLYVRGTQQPEPQPMPQIQPPIPVAFHQSFDELTPTRRQTTSTVAEIKDRLLGTINARSNLKVKHHLQSLLFGAGMGTVVILILLFGFFNERFIAPFITPSRTVSNTPIIVDPNSSAVGSDPLLVIPKINLELPVVYTEPSVEESAIQKALESGVVHYATTSSPGEQGNGVIFGHSSNNILNKGKYKFAFVLLKKLETGDTFYIQKDGKRYSYRVYEKKIVKPEDVGVLGNQGKPATFTLITCDPPGTSINRLVVVAEQISPDPSSNLASTAKSDSAKPRILPSNSVSMWQRIKNWF